MMLVVWGILAHESGLLLPKDQSKPQLCVPE